MYSIRTDLIQPSLCFFTLGCQICVFGCMTGKCNLQNYTLGKIVNYIQLFLGLALNPISSNTVTLNVVQTSLFEWPCQGHNFLVFTIAYSNLIVSMCVSNRVRQLASPLSKKMYLATDTILSHKLQFDYTAIGYFIIHRDGKSSHCYYHSVLKSCQKNILKQIK